ncbi:fatty acid desaturase family protein [Leptolyngbya sp. NIES-2104]|uniref:fatty acid desaturase family protein n=1 Tax=Leptolyngbya sp. NIES-2104 TaxID=1552121 RepID=UPI0006EC4873|nr:fatty acid desaturase [Leptolyngbya sp. NIES-2104]GAP93690.1 fatty acid desaturase [Leptolyngbya sp. NIES-2104]
MHVSQPVLTHQATYVKTLRAFLPKTAFQPNVDRVVILMINFAILILGWGIASNLDRWSWSALWLYLPFTIVMANSVIVLLFSVHDIMHSRLIKNRALLYVITLLALTPLWMPPTLWSILHNRIHHNHTNSLKDPDRRYLQKQPMSWGKWIQRLIAPSLQTNRILMLVGMMFAWGVYAFRNFSSIVLFNTNDVNYVPASFTVKPRERYFIAAECLIMLLFHVSVITYLEFDGLKLLLSYFLPIGLGYAGIIFYVYTNHMLCPMTETNDPLVNSISLRVPPLLNVLHFNFSHHAEHHIFPNLNSDYYPLVQDLIKVHYPDSTGYILAMQTAWRLLLTTPQENRTAMPEIQAIAVSEEVPHAPSAKDF